ncbi:hypothetical protein AWE81_26790 [Escherichia coli]|nr:hypothetical protein AWE81_26790 [Escherichia coli]
MPQPALNGDVIHRFLRFRGGAFLLLAAFVVQRQGHHFLFARRRRQVFLHSRGFDVGQSISRCMNQVTSLDHQQSARALKQNYAAYMEIKPLIPLGGYVAGADASVDKAVKMFPAIERFLRQDMREPAALELVQSRLQILFPGVKKAEQ